MDQLTSFASGATDQQYSRYAWILKSIVDEVFCEISERAAQTEDDVMEKLPTLFTGFGAVMTWCGSGDPNDLPPELLHIFIQRYPNEIKAIESGKVA